MNPSSQLVSAASAPAGTQMISYLKFKHLLCEGPINGLYRKNKGTAKTLDVAAGNKHIGCANMTGVTTGQFVYARGIPLGSQIVSTDTNFFTIDNDPTETNSSILGYVGGTSGLESVFFNETPLQNDDGTFNFKGWELYGTHGSETQNSIEGYDQIESAVGGITSSAIKYGETTHIGTISTVSATAARLLFSVPQMYKMDASGKPTGSTFSYEIDVKPTAPEALWRTVHTDVQNLQVTSPYAFSVLVQLHGTGPWQIRVRRTTADATDALKEVNAFYWSSLFEITETKLTYPFSALMAGQIDASQIDNLPNISYLMEMKIVKVPANYDPVARTYDGIWDGTFKEAWTDNPAWCFYDLITNTRYGIGNYVDSQFVDKWSLYSIGQYCDVMLDDGFGGTEPRFTCNLFLQSREEAFKVVAHFASIFRGMIYWSAGQVMFHQDKADTPVFTFTQANVENGLFTYTGSALNARHSVAVVSWNDLSDFSKLKYEYVEHQDSVLDYGIRELQLNGFGCASRAMARRIGLWALYSEREETDAVQFVTSFDAMQSGVAPGKIINIVDPQRAGKRLGGRLVQIISTTSVKLDAAVQFENGKTYTFYGIDADGALFTRTITTANTTTDTIVFSAVMPVGKEAVANSVWGIAVNDLAPQTFKVLSVEEKGTNKFVISALEYDANKYDEVELGQTFDDTPITSWTRPKTQVYAPTDITISDEAAILPEGIQRTISVGWTPSPSETLLKEFEVEFSYANVGWASAGPGKTNQSHLTFTAFIPADYNIRVRAVNQYGFKSRWVYKNFVLPTDSIPVGAVTKLELDGQGNNTAFTGSDPTFTWSYNNPGLQTIDPLKPAAALLVDTYFVRILVGGIEVRAEQVQEPKYTYTYLKNFLDNGDAVREFTIQVVARDTLMRFSTAASLTVVNAAPLLGAVPPTWDTSLLRLNSAAGHIELSYDAPSDPDFAGVMVFVKKTTGSFDLTEIRPTAADAPTEAALTPYDKTANTGMLLYKGSDTTIVVDLDPTQSYKMIVAPYDRFGLEGLNYYGPRAVTVSWTVDTTPPATPAGLALTTYSEIGADGTQRVYLVAKFTPNAESDLDRYSWYILRTGGGYVPATMTSPARTNSGGYVQDGDGKVTRQWEISPGAEYTVKVAAIDASGNVSAYSSPATITGAADTVGPATPGFTSATVAFRLVTLKWAPVADDDFNHFELWQNTVDNFNTATKIKETASTTAEIQFPVTGNFSGVTYYFWLVARDHTGNASTTSSSTSVTLGGIAVPSSVTTATSVLSDFDGTQRPIIVVSWAAPVSAEVVSHTVEIASTLDGAALDRQTVTSNSVRFFVLGNTTYYIRVRANDANAGFSAWAYPNPTFRVAARDTTAPGAPTGLTAISAIRSVFLQWTNPTDKDYAHTDIFRNTTNSFPGGTPYAEHAGTAWVDSNVSIGQTYYYFIKSEDTSGNESASYATASATPGQVVSSDITSFAVGLTQRYHSTIALQNDSWTNNSPTSLAIAWNSHTLYFQGAAYTITAGNTTNGYVYWDSASPTVYQTSATNPTLTDTQFMIATNVGGAHDLAWNAMANALIGTAYIQNLAVTNAKIESLAVDKLTAGSITSKEIVIAGGVAGVIRSDNYTATTGWKIDGSGKLYAMDAEIKGGVTIGNPGAAGLYLGADKLGYYNGATWTAYIDSSGNMKLGDKLNWDATGPGVLTITGYIAVGGAAGDVNGGVTTISGGKITTGSITAEQLNATITTTKELVLDYGTTGGTIRSAGATALTTGDGLWIKYGASGAEFRFGNPGVGGQHIKYSNGTLTIAGAVTFSGVSSLADTAFSSDFASVTGVTKPANNATVGATFGTNLTGGPFNSPSGTGMFIDSTHMGYYTSGAWKTYFDATGNFYFNSTAGNAFRWNGTYLGIYTSGTDAAYNATNTPFYVDTTGKFSLKQKLKFDGTNLTIAGELSAATGTFAGELSAATGTFAGSMSIGTGINALKINTTDGLLIGNPAGKNVWIWNDSTYTFVSVRDGTSDRVLLGQDNTNGGSLSVRNTSGTIKVLLKGDGTGEFDSTLTAASLVLSGSITGATTGSFSGEVTAGSFNKSSSLRFKENVRPFGDVWGIINALDCVRFNWRAADKKDDYGFIAEEVAKVLPTAAAYDSSGLPLAVDYGHVCSVLWAAVKDLAQQVTDLKNAVRN